MMVLAPLAVAMVAVGLTAFVSILVLAQGDGQKWEMTESVMRSAIAGSMVLVYLVLVGITAFFNTVSKDQAQQLRPITQMMISNFTYIIGVVIAFYFGVSAFTQAKSRSGVQIPPGAPYFIVFSARGRDGIRRFMITD